jgi:hypothetical protein
LSGSIKSVNARRPPGSIRQGGRPPRGSDVKAPPDGPDAPSTAVTVQSIDISPRPDTANSDNSLERGRKMTTKSIKIHGDKKNPAVQTTISMANQVSGKATQLKTLAIKMLWYPISMSGLRSSPAQTSNSFNSISHLDHANCCLPCRLERECQLVRHAGLYVPPLAHGTVSIYFYPGSI